MKKGLEYTVRIEEMEFPNRAYGIVEDTKVYVKNAFKGQLLKVRITKKRRKKVEGKLIEVLEKAPCEIESKCKHFENCGGCSFQNIPYKEQIDMKSYLIQKLFKKHGLEMGEYEGILASPKSSEYRNKMEFSFGDSEKNGPLCLGMHKRESFYDIVNVDECQLVDEDYRKLLIKTREYFSKIDATYFHRKTHKGYLRHLVVRKGDKTEEIMVNLITTSQMKLDLTPWAEEIKALPLKNELKCILHTENNALSDTVQAENIEVLYGEPLIQESLLDLKFNISPFSFFQTNSLGAEVLYKKVREYAGDLKDKTVFDLYSGTGTIAQIMAPVVKEVVGIEIVEEAVVAAKENAKLNNLNNCTFIAGDVLEKVSSIKQVPDVIVLDPPRAGIHPKAIQKILKYNPKTFVYVSCKASSLVEDIPHFLEAGYKVQKTCLVDMFPGTGHVECVVLMSKA